MSDDTQRDDQRDPHPNPHENETQPSKPPRLKGKPGEWRQVDEESDESFPASDPPANY